MSALGYRSVDAVAGHFRQFGRGVLRWCGLMVDP
jgi:hypothetical protein